MDLRNSENWRAKNENKIEKIPDAIEHLENLEELYVSKVKLEVVPDNLTKLTQLKVLDLYYNELEKLPDLSPLKELKILHLFINRLTKIEGIEHLTELEHLDLGANKLKTITDKIGTLKKLKVLNLCSNDITTLPDSLCNLSRLDKLDIYDLQLNGQLPKDFSKLSYLPWLRFDDIGRTAYLKEFTKLKILRCTHNSRYYEFSKKPTAIQAFLAENIG